jgi:methylthioribose-1-phosphate isomerase
MKENRLNCDTVALDDENSALVIIDQTRLPHEVKLLHLTDQQDIREAICKLRVRGAPAIGVAAAIGAYLAAKASRATTYDAFCAEFRAAKDNLASSRPTAVNLFWALDRMERVVRESRELPVDAIKRRLRDEAAAILEEDIRVCRSIGEHGLSLLRDGDGILTHCNAGQLAAVRYGTALAPIHLGRERGYKFRVFTDETRPLLQGARLSAFELAAHGIDTTVICDSMASQVMKNGWVQAVLVGCDRVAANGDACNKIGTSGVAILARYYGIPFYVCAPTSTIDMNARTGADIPIEERPAHEVTEMWYEARMAPEGVNVYNPAFDVADSALITAIVTEYGIARAPYGESLKEIFERKAGAQEAKK